MRLCKKCLETKELSSFVKHSCGFRHTCKACYNLISYKWTSSNKARRLEIIKKSRKKTDTWKNYANKWKSVNGETAKARAARLNRTPEWLTQEDWLTIKGMYAMRQRVEHCLGIKHHVDHIVPLRGELVSGLHVPWNLAVTTATANLRKNNKMHFQLKAL